MPNSVDLSDSDSRLAACIPAGVRLPAHAVKVPPGRIDPLAVGEDAFALLLVAGVIRSEVHFGDRTVAETLVAGDVLLPAAPQGDGFAARRSVSALSWCVLARLDANFIAAAARWPELMRDLHGRLADQEHRIAVSGAIGQMPRTDERIEATFDQLAARLGKPVPEGRLVPLTMTHAAIGRMVGASRPTVSLALGRLAERGRLLRCANGHWLIANTPD